MKIHSSKTTGQAGNTLFAVVVIGGVLSIAAAAMLALSTTGIDESYSRTDYNSAFYNAQNALSWAAQGVLDSPPATGSSNYYSISAGTLPISYMTAQPSTNGGTNVNYTRTASQSGLKNAWVSVVNTNGSPTNCFLITASAQVNNKIRTLQSVVYINPPSQVFDYEYFLNNWGWWWGSTITGNGGQRANWDFDFQDNPQVNGFIYAANQVEGNEQPYTSYSSPPFAGLAGANAVYYVHQAVPRVVMPNLLNFTNYINTALANTASNGLWLGSTQLVFGVQTNTSQPGLYVRGTSSQPVTIKGTVVVPGDLVIGGVITGRGTVYVGGNLYITTNLTYANGPNFTTAPETMSVSNCNAWVAQNTNKDLIAFAVRLAVFAGDVTSNDWVSWCYNYPGSGLASVGDESHLGADGIAGTPDDNTPFLHADGTMSTWYDADGDGVCESNYNYNTQINMTAARASLILNYPTNTSGPVPYNTVASDNMGTLEGIFYTDHAFAMRLAQSTAVFHGVIVSRNEQIVFQNYLNLTYDSRVNSRYNSNPNTFINLGLPYGKPIVGSFAELSTASSSSSGN